jgi:predicted nucleic acid-binding protein
MSPQIPEVSPTISALRAQGIPVGRVIEFLLDTRKILHTTLPVTAEIAGEALRQYREHGGARKLHYFDSFHTATAKHHHLPLLTSDEYVIERAAELGISVLDVRRVEK